jgi:hypothetical protein
MTNQHAGLSETLAEQRITERHQRRATIRGWYAALARPAAGGEGHGCPVAGGSSLAGPASLQTSQSPAPQSSTDRSEAACGARPGTCPAAHRTTRAVHPCSLLT